MSNKIKLAEKYSRIANLLDEVGEHEIADACTVIVNRLASDKSFIKDYKVITKLVVSLDYCLDNLIIYMHVHGLHQNRCVQFSTMIRH